MTDLTAIKTPFGLLDRETQEALKAHGGPYQMFSTNAGGWTDKDADAVGQFIGVTYRVKPAPPKPREWWLVQWDAGQTLSPNDDEVQAHKDAASLRAHGHTGVEVIHVREVLPE